MRPDPLYFSWCIRLPSEQDAPKVGSVVDALSVPGAGLTDEVEAQVGAVQFTREEPHAIADYFETISLTPSQDDPCKLSLVFQRSPAAGRFWKDVMAHVLNLVRTTVAGTSISIEYKGDVAPPVPSLS